MRNRAGRLVVLAIASVALSGGFARASAETTRVATTMTADPAFGIYVFIAHEHALLDTWAWGFGPSARLLDRASGDGIGGRPVTFSAGGSFLCDATTSSYGLASCYGTREENLLRFSIVLANGGYQATFAGDHAFAPAQAHGHLARVNDSAV